MWKNGIDARHVAVPGSEPRNQAAHCSAFATRLRWVSIAAFGSPVVPPVYWRSATSAEGSPASGGNEPERAIATFHRRMLGPSGKRVENLRRRNTRLTNGRAHAG